MGGSGRGRGLQTHRLYQRLYVPPTAGTRKALLILSCVGCALISERIMLTITEY